MVHHLGKEVFHWSTSGISLIVFGKKTILDNVIVDEDKDPYCSTTIFIAWFFIFLSFVFVLFFIQSTTKI